MWVRIGIPVWLVLGAFGLGLLTLQANKKGVRLKPGIFFWGLLLGPIFLFFILPVYLGKMGDKN